VFFGHIQGDLRKSKKKLYQKKESKFFILIDDRTIAKFAVKEKIIF
jgi:hypothetical protein